MGTKSEHNSIKIADDDSCKNSSRNNNNNNILNVLCHGVNNDDFELLDDCLKYIKMNLNEWKRMLGNDSQLRSLVMDELCLQNEQLQEASIADKWWFWGMRVNASSCNTKLETE